MKKKINYKTLKGGDMATCPTFHMGKGCSACQCMCHNVRQENSLKIIKVWSLSYFSFGYWIEGKRKIFVSLEQFI